MDSCLLYHTQTIQQWKAPSLYLYISSNEEYIFEKIEEWGWQTIIWARWGLLFVDYPKEWYTLSLINTYML